MKALLAYLCSGTATSEFTRKLQDRVEAGRNREAWKMLYMKQHSRDETIRREAFAEGEERGIAIGEKRGGDNRAAVIAKTMKDDDVPIDIISKHTGLSAEEIEKL